MDAKSAYREAAVRGATPVQLVILLYEQVIQDLRRAFLAIERNEVERRTRELNHALSVIGHLQGGLDMDQGGNVAQRLNQFYSALRSSLIKVQVHASGGGILQEQIANLLTLREAWIQVDRDVTPSE